MKRRDTLKGAMAAALLQHFPAGAAAAAAADEGHYADPVAADLWMQQWRHQPGAVNGMLSVERFADHYYYLTRKIDWRPDQPGSRLQPASVPVGFVTDFASTPRIAWSIIPPDGDYVYPAVVHDYLYWSQRTTRADADEVFRLMMKEFGIADALIATIYAAVRAGGGSAWAGNARLKQAGERRILKVFPTNPKTRWMNWKAGDVFVTGP
jgi:hypothetical protein